MKRGRHAKFGVETARQMRRAYEAGETSNEIGARFGCSNVTALKLIRWVGGTIITHGGNRKDKAAQSRHAAFNRNPAAILIRQSPSAIPVNPSSFIQPPSMARLMAGR